MPVALITGASSLMGIGIADALVEDGWRVVLTDIAPEKAEAAAERLGGQHARCLTMDVTDTEAVRATVARIAAEDGPIEGLVNVAGSYGGLGLKRKLFVESTPDEWDRVLSVNLYGTMIVTRAVLPAMIERAKGAVVSIASGAGLGGLPKASSYAAAKAAIILLTQNMSVDCAQHGVRVNTIAPGNVEAYWKAGRTGVTLPPIGHPATGRDVGNAVAFLLSERAGHVTGACLDLSGGSALH